MRFFLAFLGLAAALVAEPPKELSDKQKLEVSRLQAGLASLQLQARSSVEELRAKQEADMRANIERWNQQIEQVAKALETMAVKLAKETGQSEDCRAFDGNQKFICPDAARPAKK